WPRSLMFPHGGNQMSLAIAGGFGLGGAESYLGVFGDFGGFADAAELEDGYLKLSDRLGLGFGGPARLYCNLPRLSGLGLLDPLIPWAFGYSPVRPLSRITARQRAISSRI